MSTMSKVPKTTNFVPVGKSKFARWANNWSVAHLHGETTEMNLRYTPLKAFTSGLAASQNAEAVHLASSVELGRFRQLQGGLFLDHASWNSVPRKDIPGV